MNRIYLPSTFPNGSQAPYLIRKRTSDKPPPIPASYNPSRILRFVLMPNLEPQKKHSGKCYPITEKFNERSRKNNLTFPEKTIRLFLCIETDHKNEIRRK